MQLPLVNLSLPSDVVERLASLVSDSLGVRTARIVTDLMLMYFPVFMDVSKAITQVCGRIGAPQWVRDVATNLRDIKQT